MQFMTLTASGNLQCLTDTYTIWQCSNGSHTLTNGTRPLPNDSEPQKVMEFKASNFQEAQKKYYNYIESLTPDKTDLADELESADCLEDQLDILLDDDVDVFEEIDMDCEDCYGTGLTKYGLVCERCLGEIS